MLDNVKSELCNDSGDRLCCAAWELRGFLDADDRSTPAATTRRVHLYTRHGPTTRRLYTLLRRAGADSVKVVRRPRGGYVVTATLGPRVVPVVSTPEGHPSPKTRHCRTSYVRGSFLARGFLNLTRHGYHWEVKAPGQVQAQRLAGILKQLGLPGVRVGRWQKGWVTYLKDSELIAEWLGLIGAHESLLAFENTRVEKDMRNKVNRRVNYETANLTRTVGAAMKQKDDIRMIRDTVGLAALPPGLRALAEARLAQPHACLAELGASLDPPLTKSGVSHRMRQIAAWADRIRHDRASRAAN